jgi:hypothetical protein
MATIHVDFEIVGVFQDQLLARFRVGDKHYDTFVNWDGRGDVVDVMRNMARGLAAEVIRPPKPPFAKLMEQVGKQGHAEVEPLPMPGDPPPVPPPPPTPIPTKA